MRIVYSPNTAHRPNHTGGPRYTFTFIDETPGATYYCRIDKRSFRACSSPAVYRNLAKGRHVFKVKSVDAAGRESAIQSVTFTAGRTRPGSSR
ncbi:MAG: hypothetical protein JST31_14820 [Actinobacteria bacterium]|nr:hypothetical protein [Actinomycetota bacterium]